MRRLFLILVLLLSGCATYTPPVHTATWTAILASTPTETREPAVTVTALIDATPQPTLFPPASPAPGKTLLSLEPTITPLPARNPPLVLPGNLVLEEYAIPAHNIYEIETSVWKNHVSESGSKLFWPSGGRIDGKLFKVSEVVIDHKTPAIHATLDNDAVFEQKCILSPIPSVITAWTYEDHWIIQSYCNQEFDIYWDGTSQNSTRGYQSSFAFQLLGGQPFYLFGRNNQVWLFYDSTETLLGYDEVKLTYCCMNFLPPQHYENMITFYASRNGQLYYAAIGLFNEE